MTKQLTRFRGVSRVIVMGAVGALLGAVLSTVGGPFAFHRITYLPDAYRVPKIPGGTALRMAMVHDVLHERYLRHGTAWYQKRNADAQKYLDNLSVTQADSQSYWDAMDDLAVGDERLGKFDDGIQLMREKLRGLPPLPLFVPSATQPDDQELYDLLGTIAAQNLTPIEHHQYTACANLGTILLIHSMSKAMAGDKVAIDQMRESLQWVERAIAINPGGHFGRERWQAILIADLLAAIEHPEILGTFDCIGDPLGNFTKHEDVRAIAYERHHVVPPPDSEIQTESRLRIRSFITKAGMYDEWAKIVKPDYSGQMPFDEPTLAIIGMWTMGGGPNPHFALALGRLMELVGQNAMAWNAYERAVELQDSVWPTQNIRQDMVKFCRDRQGHIAEFESGNAVSWQQTIRQQHQAELAWGMAYQKAYQDYEEKQIASGVALNDPNFYAKFFDRRPPIASPPGLADDFIITHLKPTDFWEALPMLMLGIGVGMFLALVIPERHLF